MKSWITSAWELQHKIEKRLHFSDKVFVVFASFLGSMVFLWGHSMHVFCSLDIWLLYIGTIGIMICPMVIWGYQNKLSRNL